MNVFGLSPYAQVGILPGAASARPGYEAPATGAALPKTTPGAGVASVANPLHPDSPVFWLVGLGLLAAGLVGASFRVHAGPARAGATVGKV